MHVPVLCFNWSDPLAYEPRKHTIKLAIWALFSFINAATNRHVLLNERTRHTFHRHPSDTCLPDRSLHLCHTTTWYNSDPTSTSFDASKSDKKQKIEHLRNQFIFIWFTPSNLYIQSDEATYRFIRIQIPWRRRHILWNMRIDFLSIFIDLSRSNTRLTRFF